MKCLSQRRDCHHPQFVKVSTNPNMKTLDPWATVGGIECCSIVLASRLAILLLIRVSLKKPKPKEAKPVFLTYAVDVEVFACVCM